MHSSRVFFYKRVDHVLQHLLEEINDSHTLDILCFFFVGFVFMTNFQETYKVCK